MPPWIKLWVDTKLPVSLQVYNVYVYPAGPKSVPCRVFSFPTTWKATIVTDGSQWTAAEVFDMLVARGILEPTGSPWPLDAKLSSKFAAEMASACALAAVWIAV
jgi:hypothetical protein